MQVRFKKSALDCTSCMYINSPDPVIQIVALVSSLADVALTMEYADLSDITIINDDGGVNGNYTGFVRYDMVANGSGPYDVVINIYRPTIDERVTTLEAEMEAMRKEKANDQGGI